MDFPVFNRYFPCTKIHGALAIPFPQHQMRRSDNRRGMTLQDGIGWSTLQPGPVFLSAPCSISPAEEGAAASVRCGASPRSAPHSVATDGKYLNLGDMIHRTSTVGNWSTQWLLKSVYVNIYIYIYYLLLFWLLLSLLLLSLLLYIYIHIV